MKKISTLTLIFLLTFNYSCSQQDISAKYSNSITEKELKDLIYVYASDEFEGRNTGEPGQKLAVNFIRDFYKANDINKAVNTEDYFQKFLVDFSGRQVVSPDYIDIPITSERVNWVKTENVAAIIRGSEKPDEYIILTAHLDHVGRKGDDIYNGADDDGSGTVAILEIAEAFNEAAKKGHGPDRSIVFLHVTAEEMGLIGSRYYTDEDPIVPLKNTVTNLNIDMIGRTDPERPKRNRDYIYIIGSDKISQELHDVNEAVNDLYLNIDLDYVFNAEDHPQRFYYRSDHYNFAKNNIPVIFYFNGIHEDYHKPTDTVEKIDFDKIQKITRLVFLTAWEVANKDARIVVDKAEKDES